MFKKSVLVVGIFIALRSTCGAQTCDQTSRLRPVQGGVSVSGFDHPRLVGTLGALVQDSTGTKYVLTANHILGAPNRTLPHEGIEQPAHVDGGHPEHDEIVELTRYVHIDYSRAASNHVDAAIARVLEPDLFLSRILNIGQISSSPAPATLNMRLRKMGRSTCLQQGTVASISVRIAVNLSSAHSPVTMIDQIIVTGVDEFAEPGDAGSLLMTNESCPRPVGMLIGASNDGRTAIATPIDAVLSSLDVKVVGSCGTNTSASPSDAMGEADGLEPAGPAVTAATTTRDCHSTEFERLPGYVGSGIGMDSTSGQPVVDILVDHVTSSLERVVPASVNDVPLRLVETGSIKAL
jgi:hypothetical protein